MLTLLVYGILQLGSTQTLSLEFVGAPLSRIVAAVADQTKRDLRVDPSLANMIVVAKVKHVSTDEFVRHLAIVVDAQWKEDGNRRTLVRSPETLRGEAKEENTVRSAAVEGALKELIRQGNSYGTSYERAERIVQTMGSESAPGQAVPSSPAFWLMSSLVEGLGPSEFVSLEPGVPRVYSNAPTAAQRAFPRDTTDLLKAYLQTEEDLRNLVSNLDSSAPVDELGKRIGRPDGIRKFDLLVTQTNDVFNLQLRVYAPDGRWRGADFRTFAARPDGCPLPKEVSDWDLPKNAELPPLGRELVPHLQAANAGAPSTTAASQALLNALADPVKFDPISFVLGPSLISIAEHENRNLLASVSDDVLDAADPPGAAQTTDLRLLAVKLAQAGYEISVDGDWLLIKPRLALRADAFRSSRAALATMIRTARAEGRVSLRNFATYRYALGTARFDLGRRTLGLLPLMGAETPGPNQFPLSTSLLGLLGSLSDSKWRDLIDGRPIEVAQLGSEQLELFRGWTNRVLGLYRLDVAFNSRSIPEILENGSESMPDRIPQNCYLRAASVSELVVSPRVPDAKPWSTIILSPETFAHGFEEAFAASHAATLEETIASQPELADQPYDYGRSTATRFWCEPIRGVVYEETYLEPPVTRSSPVPYSQLPASFREAVNRALKRSGHGRRAANTLGLDGRIESLLCSRPRTGVSQRSP
ncbi:MAG: hypothetical protein H6534_01005 [Chthonomonadaceae bacterium]|nr:hypothetical protein [Chthonomonadaceae bacterium]